MINRVYIWIHNCSNSSAISYVPSIVRFLIFFVVLSARVVKEKGQKAELIQADHIGTIWSGCNIFFSPTLWVTIWNIANRNEGIEMVKNYTQLVDKEFDFLI